jgi:hypothetical protein
MVTQRIFVLYTPTPAKSKGASKDVISFVLVASLSPGRPSSPPLPHCGSLLGGG